MGGKRYLWKRNPYAAMEIDEPLVNPDGEDESGVHYRNFLEKSKSGIPSFDTYMLCLSRAMQDYDLIDPHAIDALKPLTDKADAFLKRHAGISYQDFLRQSRPEDFVGNDYGKLPPRRNLRRRLFRHRTMLYLAALEDYEKLRHDVGEVLTEIRKRKIPYLKKELNEPTLEEILNVLRKKN